MLKRIFYGSCSLVMLALAWHLFSGDAAGQVQKHPEIAGMAVYTDGRHLMIYTISPDGDVHVRVMANAAAFDNEKDGLTPVARLVGNFWGPVH